MSKTNSSQLLAQITRDPNYVSRLNGTQDASNATGKSWDGRFALGNIPRYDALNDRFCKFSRLQRVRRNQQQQQKANAFASGNMQPGLPGSRGGRLPALTHHSGLPLDHQQQGQSSALPTAQQQQVAESREAQKAESVNTANLEMLFVKSKQRLIKLWDELGTPEHERLQFTQHNFGAATPDTFALINDEIQKLLNERNGAVQVEKAIEIREGFLYLLQELTERYSTTNMDRDRAMRELNALTAPYRNASLDVCEAIVRWREAARNDDAPYLWKGVSYLHKMNSDLFFLAHSRLRLLLDFELASNPLLDPRRASSASFGATVGEKLPPIRSSSSRGGGSRGALGGDANLKDLPRERIDRAMEVLRAEAERQRAFVAQQQQRKASATGGDDKDGSEAAPGENNQILTAAELQHARHGVITEESERQALMQEEEQWLVANQHKANTHELERAAATKIQTLYRGHMARRQTSAKLLKRSAAIKLQSHIRRLLAKCQVDRLRTDTRDARRVQALHRGKATRRRIGGVRRTQAAATSIQRVFRGHLCRKRCQLLRFVRWAAVTIQRLWRGHRDRRAVRCITDGARTDAATLLQKTFRGFRVRKNPLYNPAKVKRVVKLQAWFRGTLVRKEAALLALIRHAATRIQCHWRAHKARLAVTALKQQRIDTLYFAALHRHRAAAVRIQSAYRMHLAICERRRRVEEKGEAAQAEALSLLQEAHRVQRAHEKRQTDAAIGIQRVARGRMGRNRAKLALAVHWAAANMQRLVRGHLARRRVETMRKERLLLSAADLTIHTPGSELFSFLRKREEESDNNNDASQSAAAAAAEGVATRLQMDPPDVSEVKDSADVTAASADHQQAADVADTAEQPQQPNDSAVAEDTATPHQSAIVDDNEDDKKGAAATSAAEGKKSNDVADPSKPVDSHTDNKADDAVEQQDHNQQKPSDHDDDDDNNTTPTDQNVSAITNATAAAALSPDDASRRITSGFRTVQARSRRHRQAMATRNTAAKAQGLARQVEKETAAAAIQSAGKKYLSSKRAAATRQERQQGRQASLKRAASQQEREYAAGVLQTRLYPVARARRVVQEKRWVRAHRQRQDDRAQLQNESALIISSFMRFATGKRRAARRAQLRQMRRAEAQNASVTQEEAFAAGRVLAVTEGFAARKKAAAAAAERQRKLAAAAAASASPDPFAAFVATPTNKKSDGEAAATASNSGFRGSSSGLSPDSAMKGKAHGHKRRDSHVGFEAIVLASEAVAHPKLQEPPLHRPREDDEKVLAHKDEDASVSRFDPHETHMAASGSRRRNDDKDDDDASKKDGAAAVAVETKEAAPSTVTQPASDDQQPSTSSSIGATPPPMAEDREIMAFVHLWAKDRVRSAMDRIEEQQQQQEEETLKQQQEAKEEGATQPATEQDTKPFASAEGQQTHLSPHPARKSEDDHCSSSAGRGGGGRRRSVSFDANAAAAADAEAAHHHPKLEEPPLHRPREHDEKVLAHKDEDASVAKFDPHATHMAASSQNQVLGDDDDDSSSKKEEAEEIARKDKDAAAAAAAAAAKRRAEVLDKEVAAAAVSEAITAAVAMVENQKEEKTQDTAESEAAAATAVAEQSPSTAQKDEETTTASQEQHQEEERQAEDSHNDDTTTDATAATADLDLAARKIQSAQRQRSARASATRKRQERDEKRQRLQQREAEAAAAEQEAQLALAKQREDRAVQQLQERAALKIQCAVRCYNARFMRQWMEAARREKRQKAREAEEDATQWRSAVRIQKLWRSALAKIAVKAKRRARDSARLRKRREDLRLARAATRIQCAWKQHNARFEVAWRREARDEKRAAEAARLAEENAAANEAERKAAEAKQLAEKAVVVQCAWRSYNARTDAARRREDRDEKRSAVQQQQSLDRMQRVGRGFMRRLSLRLALAREDQAKAEAAEAVNRALQQKALEDL